MPVNHQHGTHRPLPLQRGVGLIEVLIAVLVLAIGLLGLAGLQIRTLRDNASASERGVAVAQTHSIVDAMRADRTNATNGLFNIAKDAADPTGTTFREVAISAWRAGLKTALGSAATGSIDCNGSSCTINIIWDDSRATQLAGEDSTQFSMETVVQL